jgi:CheY-like chemotaxis protein
MNKTLRVLMIEDSENDAILMSRTLRREGYDVVYEIVDTSSAMRAALEHHDWDIITADHGMPKFSAPEALAIAKELRPDLPFIIVSGEIEINMAVALMKGGAQDYVRKTELFRLVPAIERGMKEAESIKKRKQAEEELQKRVKELNCLYSIAYFIEKMDSLEDLFQSVVNDMLHSWYYPEHACARITYKDQEFKTANFQKTVWTQSAELIAHGKPVGTVDICYLDKMPDRDEGPFIQEERNLINAIAGRLGRVIERKWAEEERCHYERLHGVVEMAGTICHELNQPMQTIAGYIELILKNTEENDPIHVKADKINKQLHRMVTITEKLMRIDNCESEDYAGFSRIIKFNQNSANNAK